MGGDIKGRAQDIVSMFRSISSHSVGLSCSFLYIHTSKMRRRHMLTQCIALWVLGRLHAMYLTYDISNVTPMTVVWLLMCGTIDYKQGRCIPWEGWLERRGRGKRGGNLAETPFHGWGWWRDISYIYRMPSFVNCSVEYAWWVWCVDDFPRRFLFNSTFLSKWG